MGYYPDTIAAIATPGGSGGIGIIRISGPQSISIAKALFRPCKTRLSETPDNHFISHRFSYGCIVDPVTHAMIDEVMLVVMNAPKSYTREDVVEIQSHGGSVIVRKILEIAIAFGARAAEPGEFTKRAFFNGRIDLSQAEAVADLIQAKSEKALQMAATNLSGAMKATVKDLVSGITEIAALLEAGIEFPEEIDIEPDCKNLAARVESEYLALIDNLLARCHEGQLLREGIRIAIVGRPNVGKSSLLNRLVQKDRSIVTDIPGTTRDIVEVQCCLDGIPVVITDTAGLHLSQDPIEIIGMRKTKESIVQADIILLLIDSSDPFTPDDMAIFEQTPSDKVILVINKCDLPGNSVKQPAWVSNRGLASVRISALTGENLKGLQDSIIHRCLHGERLIMGAGHDVLPNVRQKAWLQAAKDSLFDAVEGLRGGHSFELVASDLESAIKALKSITGENLDSDILGEIFGRFCIGK